MSISSNAVVTKITVTGSNADASEISEFLFRHFRDTSTKFGISGTTAVETDHAFTITCSAAGEDWQCNFRRRNTSEIFVAVASGTGSDGKSADTFFLTPGVAGGAAPTLTGTDTSGECLAIDLVLGGIQDPTDDSIDMVVVELDDAFFILFEDGAQPTGSYYPYSCHAGRVMVPFFETDKNGGPDGLGVMGPNESGMLSPGTDDCRIKAYVTGAYDTGTPVSNQDNGGWKRWNALTNYQTNNMYLLSGTIAPEPYIVNLFDVNLANSDCFVGFTKYLFHLCDDTGVGRVAKTGVFNGLTGADQDSMVFITDTTFTEEVVIPWTNDGAGTLDPQP